MWIRGRGFQGQTHVLRFCCINRNKRETWMIDGSPEKVQNLRGIMITENLRKRRDTTKILKFSKVSIEAMRKSVVDLAMKGLL